jgi:ADP-heptose:LPS heptosyltransferase
MKKILIIRLGAFGDALQSEGAIHDVRLQFPSAEITVLTTQPYRSVFERCPWIDRILIDPRAPRYHFIMLWRLRRMLIDERFDLIVDLQNSKRSLMYRGWLGGEWSQKDEAFNQALAKERGHALSVLERAVIQLEKAGIATHHTLYPNVGWMADDASDLLASAGLSLGYVLLLPGSSARHPHKRWPHYRALATLLMAKGFTVITAPGPDELELCADLPCPALFDDTKPVSFNLLAGLMQQASLVIGNDSGPTHLAAYLGTRGIALFGPHAGAHQIGLDAFLEIIEVDDLATLTPERVLESALSTLKNHQNP